MTLDPATLARQLHDARRSARPLSRDIVAGLPLDDAWPVQDAVCALSTGSEQIGWKVGLTSAASRAAYGADQPMAGRLFGEGLIASGGTLDPGRACAPRIEGEILLEIGSAPLADADDDMLIDSLASVRVAIEVADSRFRDWPATVAGAIADNACCGWLVVGPPVSPRAVDLVTAAMTMTGDGEEVSTGRGADCLGSPIESYRWFLGQAAEQGWLIEPGQLLLTGALGKAVPMVEGTDYQVAIEGLGTVALRYAVDPA